MTEPTRKKSEEKDPTPEISDMKINGFKLRGIPNGWGIPLLGNRIGERIVSKKLWKKGRKEKHKIEQRCGMFNSAPN